MSVRAFSKHKLYDSLFDGMHQYMYSAENLLRLENRNVSVKHIMKDVKTKHKEGVHNNRQSKPASASASKSKSPMNPDSTIHYFGVFLLQNTDLTSMN